MLLTATTRSSPESYRGVSSALYALGETGGVLLLFCVGYFPNFHTGSESPARAGPRTAPTSPVLC